MIDYNEWFTLEYLSGITQQPRQSLYVIQDINSKAIGVASAEQVSQVSAGKLFNTIGILPALYPERLGSTTFLDAYQVRYAYVLGAMANGIASADMVIAAARSGGMAFFGAAGLAADVVEKNIDKIQQTLGIQARNWGSNLIHSPNEPNLEANVAAMYLRKGVTRVSASAYMELTATIVHYACRGLHQDANGNIIRRNHVFAKLSRLEVMQQFLAPAPDTMLQALQAAGKLTEQEVALAKHIPVATNITVESDSGGHTDNRPLAALFSAAQQLTHDMQQQYQYQEPVRLGAAGSIGTPQAMAAAFAMGADYVLTGSINQACVEAGLSSEGKTMLATADVADVIMAPAADMFELGVDLQVLRHGTLFASRAKKLYRLYQQYESLDALPTVEREKIEKTIFQTTLNAIWQQTEEFFSQRDPSQVEKARKNPRYQMALVFRWYLGMASRWAIVGDESRRADYQIWCGPAMGAFNRWVKNSYLEALENRSVAQMTLNLLEGAAVVTRAQQLRSFSVPVPRAAFDYRPRKF